MSQPPSPYPPQSPFYSQAMNPIHADTPPPPPPKPNSHEASRRGTPQNTSTHWQPDNQTGTQQSAYPNNAQPYMPEPPTIEEGWLPDLVSDKSTTDLQTILKDPALISALSSQHPSYTARQQYLETLIQSNKDLANRVIEMQNHLTEVRASTETMLITHQSLEVSWRKKQAEMDAALAPWSPKALYQRFSAAITEQEAVCRAVEESFLDEDHHGRVTEKEIADWVRRVRAEASKLAARKEAKARWDEGRVGGWR
ncbi:Modifier of rudimentary Modr [Penicillium coprophilum]|uniref:Modifier of rudimentary Modr n=1 Tax=Penicillium coprophilum TaxID=36646 RepID=UPI002398F3A5|nr:Modifier of rudimentary Modr [Penicillium coprophilum]KAJ5158994.1 Modifier of rudimentary Modr [Penicillium coprophilum]